MLWTQVGVSFAVWIAVGIWAGKWARSGRCQPDSVFAGSVLMVLGAVLMLGSMKLVSMGQAIVEHSLVSWAWVATTVAGSVFVGMQVVGCVWTFQRVFSTETAPAQNASENQESHK